MKSKQDLSNTPSRDKWNKIGTAKRAGVLSPLFSVYSKDSVGIGDLEDLKLLIDWCVKTGNSILQFLPMNEVGATFCPYDALSSFALEPVYISLNSVPGTSRVNIAPKIRDLKKSFPAGRPHVDYRIKKGKLDILRYIYLAGDGKDSREFKRFREENSYWCDDFALYKALKNHHSGKPWYEWDAPYKDRDAGALEDFKNKREDEINFELWVQWNLYRQLKDAKAYAESKNILIKGDLPILISRDSADVWAHPEFFKLEYAAGAPPDMYCAKGQRWGMPAYNWEKISGNGYGYLKEKLRYAENFYDVLRIDHVAGLFRIWSIPYNEPMENAGLNGFFDPGDEKAWKEHGKKILSFMLENTNMLLVAEDLGVIPEVCPETLRDLGIPGNDVQRWVKDWKVRHDFLEPKDYRAISVSMLSTHDTTNWAAWWENEAGTIDEALFIRKCNDRGIDYDSIKGRLFDPALSRHGRPRWLGSVDSVETLASVLGKREEAIADFIDIYKNSYLEKNKLWKHFGLKGPMREKSDCDIVSAAFKITLESRSVFCINLIVDLLILGDIFKGAPYQYRINTPGTINEKNWSLAMPISLEKLLKHRVSGKIKKMVESSRRNA